MKNAITMSGLICLAAVCAGPSWGQSLDEAWAQARAINASAVPRIIAGYVVGMDPAAGKPSKPVEWVAIEGGEFTMGTDDKSGLFGDAKPIHAVTVKSFELAKTAVTVEQYAECVIKGKCTEPGTGQFCNWGKADRMTRPVNCVDWEQASKFAEFVGGRLPSESEYEYAATSGGKNQKYPWGNEEATCERAVMYGNGGFGCGTRGTMPVCSKPAGNAKVSGGELCDMVGNVWQWTQDLYHDSYAGAPIDGSAWVDTGSLRVIRGGSFYFDAGFLRADYRHGDGPGHRRVDIGFRPARSR